MALQFVTGRAGAGKSHQLYKNLIELSLKYSDQNFIAVVPEQYSMETQKEILSLHRNHGSFNIEVTSIVRLAYTVFEEQGVSAYTVMDDLGKTLVMRKILQDCRNQLTVYKEKTAMPGFAEKMKTVVSELKQYGIEQEKLKLMKDSASGRPGLRHKLNDIEIIYKAFQEYIAKNMIMAEDVLNLLCKYIPTSGFIQNTYFYFDGYTGFTPVQYDVLELLMQYSKGVTVALTLPEEENDFENVDKYELFYLSKETMIKLKNLAEKNNVPVGDVITAGTGKPYRIKENEELCFIENNIFRNKGKKYDKECEAVEIYAAANPRREVENVVVQISRYIRQKNYRYNDIAIITGDMEGYYRYLEEEFEKHHIPAFIDHKRNISSNPFVDAIKAAIEVVEKDFSYESVFHLLRLGITDIPRNEIDLLENYVLQSGRRGYKSYLRSWEKVYRGMDLESIEKINDARNILVTVMKPFREQIKQKNNTVYDYTRAVYQFVLNCNMQDKIELYSRKFDREGNLSKAREYAQIYETMISLFDRIVELMGEEKISLKDYKQILVAGFESVKVGIIPPGLDTVMVGDIERTRLKDTKKIIFFLGVNDEIVPSAGVKGGILTDQDREYLEQNSYVLAPTARENIFRQRLYLYSLLAKPTEKIYLYYSKSAADGTVRRKSYIIGNLLKMFPKLQVRDVDKETVRIENIADRESALKYLSENIREYRFERNNTTFEQLSHYLLQEEKSRKMIRLMLEGAFYKSKKPRLKEETARKLYGLSSNIGITRLERYAGCAYSQFLNNGLKLGERKKFEIAAFDIGNLYHAAINKFFHEVQDEDLAWNKLDKDIRQRILNHCVENVMEEYENEAFDSTARNLFIKGQVREIADKTVEVLVKHIKAGEFIPSEYELRVEHGQIDRVDLLEKNGKIYVKVIDYKSGDKRFSITDTMIGTQMQLMVYLKDAVDYEKKLNPQKEVVPAAGLYFHIHDPYVTKPDFTSLVDAYKENHPDCGLLDSELKALIAEEEQYKHFRMSGMVNANPDVIQMMDKNVFAKTGASDILPLSTTKNGISARSMVIDEKTYEKFIGYVCQRAEKMQEEVLNGTIDINPIEGSCDYCPYNTVCGFDRKLGDRYREIEKMSLETLGGKNEMD